VSFADRAIAAIRSAGTPLCVGIDPFPERISRVFGNARTHVSAVGDFCLEIISLAKGAAPAVKPQLGLFEPFGAEGFAAAQAVCKAAREAGLVVILDAKRGDIGTTAEGYAEAAFGPAFAADVVTVNPYMGLDTIAPFVALARAKACGVAVLVRTSNPGAADFQDLDCGGAPLWTRVGAALAPFAAELRGESGWSGLMAVAGATWPEEARRLRAMMPTSLFLVPGYGAQGAAAADALAGFVRGPHGLEGGFVNASRAVLYPAAASAAGNLSEWRGAVRDAIAAAAADLSAAAA
jgi:orotidine-5'-phosphate decarboxylase